MEGEVDARPLYIFMDLEAAHGNAYFGDIIEIAARVDPRKLSSQRFQTLINTNQNLTSFTLHVSRITPNILRGKPYFKEAFTLFINWVQQMVVTSDQMYNTKHFPVLVAHGGFDNDFMMIQSNLERNEMPLTILGENNFHFADTFVLCRKMNNSGSSLLQGCPLSIEKLHQKFHPHKSMKGQHRAMPDVEFMIKIFIESPLEKFFDRIRYVPFEERQIQYKERNTSKQETELMNENLPKGLAKATHNMTLKRLMRNGLTFKRLQNLFESAQSYLDFFDKLNDVGIDRKAAKAIACQFSSSGLICTGQMETDQRIGQSCDTVAKKDTVAKSEVALDGGTASGDLIRKRSIAISRSDSGFSDTLSMEDTSDGAPPVDLLYEWLVDDFFQPPDKYEISFGQFTQEDVRGMDEQIEALFKQLYGVKEEQVVLDEGLGQEAPMDCTTECVAQKSEATSVSRMTTLDDILSLNEMSVNDVEVTESSVKEANDLFTAHMNKLKQLKSRQEEAAREQMLSGVSEDWESEFIEDAPEYMLADTKKFIPLSVTMNDFSGTDFTEKTPLLRHFDALDTVHRTLSTATGFHVPERVKRESGRRMNNMRKCGGVHMPHDDMR